MLSVKREVLTLPVDIIQYAATNKCKKALALFTFLKFYSDGRFTLNDEAFKQCCIALSSKDQRTQQKHLNKLLQLRWLEYDKITNVYFLRSFDFIRILHEFRGRFTVKINVRDLNHYHEFFTASLISTNVLRQEFYWDKVETGRLRKAASKWSAAKRSKVFSLLSPKRPKFFGLSNRRIGTLTNCKQTRASVLKNRAAALGYLKTSHRYEDIITLTNPDYLSPVYLKEITQNKPGYIRVFPKRINGIKYYKLVRQLHDQITSLLEFKRLEKFNKIKIPRCIYIGIQKGAIKAA